MSDDPFAILGLPPLFEIDPLKVERAYLSRAAAIHPDVVGDDDEAALRSAQLNRAKAAILDPEKRANALLGLLGGPSKDQDKALPPGFLMDIMESREAIEQAIANGHEPERRSWKDWAHQQRMEYSQRIACLFRTAMVAREPQLLRAIRQELNAWRYIERLIEQLDPKYNPATQDFDV